MAWKDERVPDGRERGLETEGASVWEGSSREWYEVTRYELPRFVLSDLLHQPCRAFIFPCHVALQQAARQVHMYCSKYLYCTLILGFAKCMRCRSPKTQDLQAGPFPMDGWDTHLNGYPGCLCYQFALCSAPSPYWARERAPSRNQ